MKNVCFFNTVKFWGGGEKFYLEYAVGLKNKGYNVFLVCDQSSVLRERAEANYIPTYWLNNVGNLSFLNPVKLYRLIRFFQRQRIDVVVFSASKDFKMGGISSYLARVEKRIYRRGLALPIKNNLLNRFLLRRCITHIHANSHETKRTILQNLSGVLLPEKVRVMYNGIETRGVAVRSSEIKDIIRNRGKGLILGNAGRLVEQKGQKYLIEIAKRLKEARIPFTLFIAGTGDLRKTLEEDIAKNNLEEEVILLGFVEDIYQFMDAIDIFLLTSQWEGFGYVLVEAMLCAKPVVAFDITSNPEIVENGKTGFLVPFQDLKEFADRIIQLARDEDMRRSMGEQGRQRSRDHFRFEETFRQFEEYISEM